MGCILPCGKNCAHNTVTAPKLSSGKSRICTDMRIRQSSTKQITEKAIKLAALKKLKNKPCSVSNTGNKCMPCAIKPNSVVPVTNVVLNVVRRQKQPRMYKQVAK